MWESLLECGEGKGRFGEGVGGVGKCVEMWGEVWGVLGCEGRYERSVGGGVGCVAKCVRVWGRSGEVWGSVLGSGKVLGEMWRSVLGSGEVLE